VTAGIVEMDVFRADSGDSGSPESHGAEPSPTEVGRPVLVRRVVGAVVTAFGILVVLLLVFLFAFTPLTAARDQHRLLASLTGNSSGTFALTKGVVPSEGSPVALLRIPDLRLEQVVVAGSSASDLEQGPGLMPGTVLPGEQGNAVIAGRRMTFGGPFRSIGTLQHGAQIHVTDGLGSFVYRVVSVRTVDSGRPDVVGGTHAYQLTLITSNSSVVTTGREVVDAKLVGRPAPSPTQASQIIPPDQRGLSGDPGAWWRILLWVTLFLLTAAATGVALLRWRRPLPTYLLAAPVLIACGLFAVEAVALSLPATL
jgi:sortase A